jgi:transcription elongation factor GreA
MKEEFVNETDAFMMSKKGYEEMLKKLEYLKTVKRKEVSEKIKQAIAFGDLSENAEYDEAKKEQAFLESEIARLESELKHAEIIDEKGLSTSKVAVGCKVILEDLEKKKKVQYYITGRLESDPLNGKISWKSPVGSALIGHKKGDIVEIKVPRGTIKYKIVKIQKG